MKQDIRICSVCGEHYCSKCSGVFKDFTYICSEDCFIETFKKQFEKKIDEVFDTQLIPKTNIPNQIYRGPCLACNGFHPIGMACPIWTVTSEGE